jgi:hypothetical protein
MAECGPEEQEPGGSRRPWSSKSGPYRDDPSPLKPEERSAFLLQQEELAPEPEEKSDPVCTCGRCLEDGQKCCHDIPGWQRKYNSGCLKGQCPVTMPPSGHICLLDLPNFKNIFNEDSHR